MRYLALGWERAGQAKVGEDANLEAGDRADPVVGECDDGYIDGDDETAVLMYGAETTPVASAPAPNASPSATLDLPQPLHLRPQTVRRRTS